MPQSGTIEGPPFPDNEERDAIRAADDSLGLRDPEPKKRSQLP